MTTKYNTGRSIGIDFLVGAFPRQSGAVLGYHENHRCPAMCADRRTSHGVLQTAAYGYYIIHAWLPESLGLPARGLAMPVRTCRCLLRM